MVNRGFSLIELLIALTILAIVAAFAVPSYGAYVTETRRSDAHIALIRVAQQQEQFHSLNSNYATALTDLGAAGQSAQGYYTLSLANVGCTTGYVGCFQVTATAVGAQASDTPCATLSLDQSGLRSATGGGTECWP